MLKRCLTSLTGLVCILSYGQQDLAYIKPHYKEIRNAFNHEDHGFWGFSMGITANLGKTQIIQSAPGLTVNDNNVNTIDRLDFFGFRNINFFGGYVHKNHIFQINLGTAFSLINYSMSNVDYYSGNLTNVHMKAAPTFLGVSFRYMYSLPFYSRYLKLSIGPQIGYAGRISNIQSNDYHNNMGVKSSSSKICIPVGIFSRFDFKVARNITLITELAYTYLVQPDNEQVLGYKYYDPSINSSYPVTGSVRESGHNINLSVGLKFEFYSVPNQILAYNRINQKTYSHYCKQKIQTLTGLDSIVKINREAANRTNYFYLGIETGILFAPAWTRAEDPNQQQYASVTGEATPLQATRLFLGGAYKRNHFEFALGGLITSFGYSGQYVSRQYISLLFRYYYSVLPKSKRWKLLTGPEIGIGFQTPINWIAGDEKVLEYNSYPGSHYSIQYHATERITGIAGYNARMQYKAAKNLSVFFQSGFSMSFTQIPQNNTSIYYDGANHPATFYGSTVNFNFTIGLTVDMLDQKDFRKNQENKK